MLLYKYYGNASDYAVTNLKSGEVSFVDIFQMNDPFEAICKYDQKINNHTDIPLSPQQKNLIKCYENSLSQSNTDELKCKYNILCLSEEYDNPLMWAHYANSHTGFCVGYDKDEIESISLKLKKIHYQDTVPSLNNCNNEEVLFFKYNCWSYEKEWRAIVESPQTLIQEKEIDDIAKESDYRLFELRGATSSIYKKKKKYISKKCLPRVIYLGLNIDGTLEKSLTDWCRNNNIDIYKMAQRNIEFKLYRKELDYKNQNGVKI